MSVDDESKQIFVSSRGILKSCLIHSTTPISSIPVLHGYDLRPFKQYATFYVCTKALPDFINRLWMNIPCPIILVTGDCDLSSYTDIFPSHADFLKFIEDPRIYRWCSQNCVSKHPKLMPIPIGMDYHTMSVGDSDWGERMTPFAQELLLNRIRVEAPALPIRIIKAYSNFHFSMGTRFGYDRYDAKAQIPGSCVYYEPVMLSREETWRKQTHYVFVLSPHGNGLDCHRTWEALLLGCIPIVKTSAIDSLYDGLPVWIVDEWSDVTLPNMIRVFADFNTRIFDMERLTLKYWLNKMTEIR
jgi:hypothetical protein